MHSYTKALLLGLAFASVLAFVMLGSGTASVEATSAIPFYCCVDGCDADWDACYAACGINDFRCELACNNAWWACNDACANADPGFP